MRITLNSCIYKQNNMFINSNSNFCNYFTVGYFVKNQRFLIFSLTAEDFEQGSKHRDFHNEFSLLSSTCSQSIS